MTRKCPRTIQHENTSMTPTTPPLCYTFELTAGLRHPEHSEAGPT